MKSPATALTVTPETLQEDQAGLSELEISSNATRARTLSPMAKKRENPSAQQRESEEAALSPREVRVLMAFVLCLPTIAIISVWLSAGSYLVQLLMLEVVITSVLGISEARKAQASARRNAQSVFALNAILTVLAGGLSDNFFVLVLGVLLGLAVALRASLLVRKPLVAIATWAMLVLSLGIGIGMPLLGKLSLQAGADSFKAGRWDEAKQELKVASLVASLKGGADLERALIYLRLAEAEIRSGDPSAGLKRLDDLKPLALNLPLPIETGTIKRRQRRTLAYQVYHEGVRGLEARAYLAEIWGTQARYRDEILGEYDIYPSDELGWAESLVNMNRLNDFVAPSENED